MMKAEKAVQCDATNEASLSSLSAVLHSDDVGSTFLLLLSFETAWISYTFSVELLSLIMSRVKMKLDDAIDSTINV